MYDAGYTVTKKEGLINKVSSLEKEFFFNMTIYYGIVSISDGTRIWIALSLILTVVI